ncbi:MAG TPA: aldehyde dehydrogenase family protein [Mycobacteriales bacterium]|nr:aldehyde dehydrogenase family protein [Mycobacteriales bacterium]
MTELAVVERLRERPGSGETITIIDPVTEEQIGEFKDGGAEAIDEAVARARATFDSGVWRNKPGSEKARILWKVAELLESRAEELAQIDSLNTGMPLPQATRNMDAVIEYFRYFAGWCTKIHGVARDIRMSGGLNGYDARIHSYTIKEPVGVVGLIIPWNGPAFNAAAKLAPSLAAGCSSVLKPAEETPLSALVFEQVLEQAGVPEGVTNLVQGWGHTAGQRLIEHKDVDKIAFTGSTEVGKKIVAAANGNLKRVMLELGGKSPSLIYDDADLERAIPAAAMGIFMHSGQACVAGSRVFVQRGVYQQVLEGISAFANRLRFGGPQDGKVHSGPIISERQMNRVLGYIDDGRSNGAEVVTGGHRLDRRGWFVHPTVLTSVEPDTRVFQEEIFGPVVAVTPFDDDDEVVALANDSTYGLAAAVYTRDLSRAHSLAGRLDAGSVTLNCQMMWDADVSFGGFKQSGWGYENGELGLDSYLRSKSVWTML